MYGLQQPNNLWNSMGQYGLPQAPIAQPWGYQPSADLGGFGDFTGQINAAGATGQPDLFSWKSFLGDTKNPGWGGLALGGAQTLGNLFMGMKQYGLAKDTLANNKAQFERNFAAQRQTTNASLEDRQRSRVASNPGAYQSVGDYMTQNRVA